MVASIASGMSGDGDFSDKIAKLLEAIGSSLDAMAMAFLTSILGVGASTMLLVSCNYLAFHFPTQYEIDRGRSNSPPPEIQAIADTLGGAVDKNMATAIDQQNRHSSEWRSEMTRIFNKLEDAHERTTAANIKSQTGLERFFKDFIEEYNAIQQGVLKWLDRIDSNQQNALTEFSHFNDFQKEMVQQLQKIENNQQNMLIEINSLREIGGKSDISSLEAGQAENNELQLKIIQALEHVVSTQQALPKQLVEGIPQPAEEVLNAISDYGEKLSEVTHSISPFSKQLEFLLNTINQSLENTDGDPSESIRSLYKIGANIQKMSSSFNRFERKSIENASFFNTIMGKNAESINELEETLSDVKKMLAPPFHESLLLAINESTLDLLFQPFVQTNHRVLGLEVSLQWNDPLMGLVSNEQVFNDSMHAHTDIMRLLYRWILENTLAKIGDWQHDRQWNNRWVVSVPLGTALTLDSAWVDHLKVLMGKYDVKGENLALEFSEKDISENLGFYTHLFSSLKKMGIRLIARDYGEGRSSLLAYRQLGITMLRMNKSLLSEDSPGNYNSLTARYLLSSSKELGMDLLVDGVDDALHCKKLIDSGFFKLQGSHFSIPISDISEMSVQL
jgi:EAL domain-containing protein (putative c-di-GMP-specific phosphodiesterase class I)